MTWLSWLILRADCLFRGHDWETKYVRRGFYLKCLNCTAETPGIEVGDGSALVRTKADDHHLLVKAAISAHVEPESEVDLPVTEWLGRAVDRSVH